ncbi:class I tRNA ligase family protein [Kocuria rhizophila]|nr:class I tRNA ligase family protein [Kocuria rhizophila]
MSELDVTGPSGAAMQRPGSGAPKGGARELRDRGAPRRGAPTPRTPPGAPRHRVHHSPGQPTSLRHVLRGGRGRQIAQDVVAPEQARGARRAPASRSRRRRTLSGSPRTVEDRCVPGCYCGEPADRRKLPVWASDYVLADHGTGVIMAVPAHDQRDLDFARAFDLPVRTVLGQRRGGTRGHGRGRHRRRHPGELRAAGRAAQGRRGGEGHRHLTNGGRYRRAPRELPAADWPLSRQRFWGAPIPSSTVPPAARCRCPRTSCRAAARGPAR